MPFEIASWNGEIVQVGFALDCCDWEALAVVAEPRDLCAADIRRLMSCAVQHRFGAGKAPGTVQWLSDNGSIYTALDTVIHAERLGLEVVTTPAASPESNGMSEAFVNTLRRDYIEATELWSAAHVIAQLPQWFRAPLATRCGFRVVTTSGYCAGNPYVDIPASIGIRSMTRRTAAPFLPMTITPTYYSRVIVLGGNLAGR